MTASTGCAYGEPRIARQAVPGKVAPAFRADIEGMRAVAVLLVVLGHAGIGALEGGYVGVDVFFVISGFLITSLLMRELAATGSISISRFYARRAVRLLPASSLVLVATLIGAWLWLSPLRHAEYARDAIASAFYSINIRLGITGTDYLAAAEPPSPFQHFWSLAVEEQFYLVWPLLLLAVTRRGRRLGGAGSHSGTAVTVALAVLTVVSLVLSITETQRSAPWAYFGAHTRAWELGLGAMVALYAARLSRLPVSVAAAATWIGLGGVVTAALLFSRSTPFPGVAATLPVVGAALVIAGGCRSPRSGARLLLDRPPMQALGRLSYGWYLWHWPILIIAPAALGLGDSVPVNLLLCGVALAAAAASLHLVENPLRHRPSLRNQPVRGIGLGLALSGTAAAVAVLAAAVPPAVPVGTRAVDLRAAVAGAADPAAVLGGFVARDSARDTLPENLTPSPAEAKRDKPAVYSDGCHLGVSETWAPGPCTYGRTDSAATVVLLGDSHAAQWFPAVERLAREHGWRLVSLTKSSCPPADVLLWEESLKRAYTECRTWRTRAISEIERLAPRLVLVASIFDDRRLADAGLDPERAWRDGWGRTFADLRSAAASVAMMVDTPYLELSAPDCVAQQPTRISRCGRTTSAALRMPARRAAVAAEAVRHGVVVVDPLPWLCSASCPVVLGNVLLYRDAHHLTTVTATMLAPLLHARLPIVKDR